MKVILVENVEKFGKVGDVIEVKDGFARNYLLPKGLAKPSSPENMRAVENLKLKAERKAEKEKQAAQEFAEKIAGISCTVTAQVGPDDKLYGAVTPADIQKALDIEGIQIDKKAISIDTPMEKLGVYHVSVNVHPQVKATLKVWVVKR